MVLIIIAIFLSQDVVDVEGGYMIQQHNICQTNMGFKLLL